MSDEKKVKESVIRGTQVVATGRETYAKIKVKTNHVMEVPIQPNFQMELLIDAKKAIDRASKDLKAMRMGDFDTAVTLLTIAGYRGSDNGDSWGDFEKMATEILKALDAHGQ